MSELADFVLEAVRSALRGTAMELAGWAIVLLIVAVCGAVLYFLLRLAGVHLTVRSGLPYAEDTTRGLADDATAGGATIGRGTAGRTPRPSGRARRFRRGPVSITYESDPQVVHLDQATLDRARESLAQGLDLDDTCRAIHPQYADWDPLLQKAFRRALRASLDAERPGEGGTGSPPDPQHERGPAPPPGPDEGGPG